MSNSKPVVWDYSLTDLENAIQAVHQGMGLQWAARIYGVPKSTLNDKVNHHTKSKPGPKPILPADLEDWIELWIIKMAWIVYGQTHEQIKDKVQELCNQLRIITPWENNRPSEKWYQLFMARHPDLHYRMCQTLACERMWSIVWWLKPMVSWVMSVPVRSWPPQPPWWPSSDIQLRWNRISHATKAAKGHNTQRGQAHIPSWHTLKKTQITVMLCNSAMGHYIPLVVYPGVQPRIELRG